MRFSVDEVNQAASGGSYVCVFDAEVDFTSENIVQVVVESVEPPSADQDLIDAATEAIRLGAMRALDNRGQGAVIRVTRLFVHVVDFKPSRFTLYTAREIERLLGNGA